MSFKYGAMNSGKSDTLIKTAFNYEERGLPLVTVKPTVDTKGEDFIVARAGGRRKVDIMATPEMNVREAIHGHIAHLALQKLDVVLVDESQFLAAEQIDQLFEVAKLDDISVIAYGLRADFRKELFEGSKRLFEIVDHIEKLPTMCFCGSQAEFNCRQVNGIYVFEGAQVAIDNEGDVTYNSLCGGCYFKEQAKTLAK